MPPPLHDYFKRLYCSLGRFLPMRRHDFQRFIVLCRSRTGSNLLMDLLHSHPHVDARGEVFRQLAGRDPDDALERVFHPRPPRIRAVGFKIFYYHPQDAPSDELWQRLQAMDDLKVIHLRRQNMLRTITSRAIASATDVWATRRGMLHRKQPETPRISLDPDQVLAEIRHTKQMEDASARFFADHALLDMQYEDLLADSEAQMQRVQALLGVELRRLHASHTRQNPQPLSQLIANYHQLKQALEQSEWAHFLEDET